MRVLILCRSPGVGGQGRALLSYTEYLRRRGVDLHVRVGEDVGVDRIAHHHGIPKRGEWGSIDFEDASKMDALESVIDPDVVFAFDHTTAERLRHVERPRVGYARTRRSSHVEVNIAPSMRRAGEFTHDAVPCYGIYPVWYLHRDKSTGVSRNFGWDERDIDIMVHKRKVNTDFLDAIDGLDANVLIASSFPWETLRTLYTRTRLFVFPRPTRDEPLGLMPIEAATYGCRVLVPEQSGVAEIYPRHAYETPSDHIDVMLRDPPDMVSNPIPDTGIDPIAVFRDAIDRFEDANP